MLNQRDRGNRIIWAVMPLRCMLVLAALAAIACSPEPPPLALSAGTVLPERVPVGDFGLVDQRAAPFGHAELRGRWTLLFAGFTHCPDICPLTTAMLADLAPRLRARGDGVRVVFLTVDPARDPPEVLARYLDHFGGGLTGLTGSEVEVDRFANALGLAHVRNPGAGGEYTVDHPAVLMLIDPDARLAAYFRPPHDVRRLEADLAPLAAAGG